jgi:hypothetical protein
MEAAARILMGTAPVPAVRRNSTRLPPSPFDESPRRIQDDIDGSPLNIDGCPTSRPPESSSVTINISG